MNYKRLRLVEYDALRRRLWIFGQRCHHGAGGSLVAAAACLGLAIERQPSPALTGLAAAGGLLMAHDWSDRSIWFERGYGTQP
jgi:hypothetical protein